MSGGPVPIWKKYTTGSVGIWEKLRQVLTLVPNRSSGNPTVKYFRNPSPASQQNNKTYKDPVTIPAGDIQNNPYFKRDNRRNYPRLSTFDQSKMSGLLKLGSAANPRVSIGDKGMKELAVYNEASAPVMLSSALTSLDPNIVKGEVLGPQGEPISAPNLSRTHFKWRVLKEAEHGMYDEEYPVRIFSDVRS